MSHERWTRAAQYGLPGLLAGLALAWTLGSGQPPLAHAQAGPNPAAAEATGTIAFATQAGGTTQLLYLIDTRTQTFAVYRIDPNDHKGTLKLEAARQYRWDLRLGEFNNQPPEVGAVQSMVSAPPGGPSSR